MRQPPVAYVSLDVSTTCTGVALFGADGELLRTFTYAPKVSKKKPNSEHFLSKAHGFHECFANELYSEPFDGTPPPLLGLWVEEPLGRSNNQLTVVVLARFNAVISYLCWQFTGVFPEHVSVYDWRRLVCPEFLTAKVLKSGKMGATTWSMPEGVDPKAYVHAKVSTWFPQAMEGATVTKADGALHSKTFDASDAVGVGVAMLLRRGVLDWAELERRGNKARRIKRK